MAQGNPNPRTDQIAPYRYQKGQSGNPYTAANRRIPIKYRLQQEFDKQSHHDPRMTREQYIAKILCDMAEDGNLEAIKYAHDRVYGKVTDRVKLEGEAGIKIVVEHVHGYGLSVDAELVSDLPALEGTVDG